MDWIRLKLAFHYIKDVRIDNSCTVWKKALVWIAQTVPLGKYVDPNKQKERLDKEFRKYPVEKSNYIGNYMGAYHKKEFFSISYFDEGRKISFEGEKFAVPKQLEKYLAHQYGDYMKLPAESSRVPKYYVLDIVRDV